MRTTFRILGHRDSRRLYLFPGTAGKSLLSLFIFWRWTCFTFLHRNHLLFLLIFVLYMFHSSSLSCRLWKYNNPWLISHEQISEPHPIISVRLPDRSKYSRLSLIPATWVYEQYKRQTHLSCWTLWWRVAHWLSFKGLSLSSLTLQLRNWSAKWGAYSSSPAGSRSTVQRYESAWHRLLDTYRAA